MFHLVIETEKQKCLISLKKNRETKKFNNIENGKANIFIFLEIEKLKCFILLEKEKCLILL